MDFYTYWRDVISPYVVARFARSQSGASLIEYALLVGLIAVVCVAAVSVLGGKTKSKFGSIGSSLQ